MTSSAMTAGEWFDKRERLASRFGVRPESVPAEVVWYMDEGPLDVVMVEQGHAIWRVLMEEKK